MAASMVTPQRCLRHRRRGHGHHYGSSSSRAAQNRARRRDAIVIARSHSRGAGLGGHRAIGSDSRQWIFLASTAGDSELDQWICTYQENEVAPDSAAIP